MNIKKVLLSSIVGLTILAGSMGIASAENQSYLVKAGDTFWNISQRFNVNCTELMNANKSSENTILQIGQTVSIPGTSQKENTSGQVNTNTNLSTNTSSNISTNTNNNTYVKANKAINLDNTYKVQRGDSLWKLSLELKVPFNDLLKANNLNTNSIIHVGDALKVPVYNIEVKETPGDQYGEYLDWWTEAQYVIPIGSVFKIEDFNTGKTFTAKRTTGSNHADLETMSLVDTKIMKDIWDGEFKWVTRPVIIHFEGRKIAASCSGMPHAGNDNDPGGLHTGWRSEGYGAGTNLDWIKNNGMHGHFDLHFKNSTRHKDGKIDQRHQKSIKTAAGIK